jgi:hypothetical protein
MVRVAERQLGTSCRSVEVVDKSEQVRNRQKICTDESFRPLTGTFGPETGAYNENDYMYKPRAR